MDSEHIFDTQGIYIGRLFTLGGSALFLIGSFIAAYFAYKDYQEALEAEPASLHKGKRR
ncbi:hypothetical protein J32TS2_35320 [Shouchella clausii]|jgi:uncharacterized membrane protein|uniref:Uncharacterized protein n=3 Tax=Bacillaceae TaxID=186817 RepID=Q5WDN1_SHOC1|nr:hypothetical protein [Shouchella clausii]MCM3313599.1 hypothetical protein [Psychrobacillus sp. MER TA 17]NKR09749.1 hypothetical protein [Escherichia coli]SHL51106.1 hypothetical protein SAMN05192535_2482 [Shouchella rhizosphaerae]MDO7267929.1 hypothetical protein [Shouchella clausii]MDO7287118.1 hypothetical protein [Shouchella clausii]